MVTSVTQWKHLYSVIITASKSVYQYKMQINCKKLHIKKLNSVTAKPAKEQMLGYSYKIPTFVNTLTI